MKHNFGTPGFLISALTFIVIVSYREAGVNTPLTRDDTHKTTSSIAHGLSFDKHITESPDNIYKKFNAFIT